MKKMKLSTLIEVLLILIIIAFAASKPVDEGKIFVLCEYFSSFNIISGYLDTRAIKYVRKNVALAKQQPIAAAVAPVVAAVEPVVVATPVAAVTPPDEVDVDDLLGLGRLSS